LRWNKQGEDDHSRWNKRQEGQLLEAEQVGKQAFSIGSFRRQSDNVEVGLYGASMHAALTVMLWSCFLMAGWLLLPLLSVTPSRAQLLLMLLRSNTRFVSVALLPAC
jgi:hypothetical protein